MEEYILDPFSETCYWDNISNNTMSKWEKINTNTQNKGIWLHLDDGQPILHISFFLLNQKLHIFADYNPTTNGSRRQIYGEVNTHISSEDGNTNRSTYIGDRMFLKLISAQLKDDPKSICVCKAIDNQGIFYKLCAYFDSHVVYGISKGAIIVFAQKINTFGPSMDMFQGTYTLPPFIEPHSLMSKESIYHNMDILRDNGAPENKLAICPLYEGEEFIIGEESTIMKDFATINSMPDLLDILIDDGEDYNINRRSTNIEVYRRLPSEDKDIITTIQNNCTAKLTTSNRIYKNYPKYNRRHFYIIRTTKSIFMADVLSDSQGKSDGVRVCLPDTIMSILLQQCSTWFYILPTKIKYPDGREIVIPVKYNPTISQLIGMEDSITTSDGKITVDAPGLREFIQAPLVKRYHKSAKSSNV